MRESIRGHVCAGWALPPTRALPKPKCSLFVHTYTRKYPEKAPGIFGFYPVFCHFLGLLAADALNNRNNSNKQ